MTQFHQRGQPGIPPILQENPDNARYMQQLHPNVRAEALELAQTISRAPNLSTFVGRWRGLVRNVRGSGGPVDVPRLVQCVLQKAYTLGDDAGGYAGQHEALMRKQQQLRDRERQMSGAGQTRVQPPGAVHETSATHGFRGTVPPPGGSGESGRTESLLRLVEPMNRTADETLAG